MPNTIVLTFPECARYGEDIARTLNIDYIVLETKQFPDGESYVRIPVDVSGRDVIIVANPYPDQDRRLMKTFLAVDAARDLNARKIIIVIPYFAYSRQDRRFRDGEAISLKTVLSILSSLGADAVLTVDVHKPEAFRHEKLNCVNVEPFKLYAEKIKSLIPSGEDIVVLSPDLGSLWRARKVAEMLNVAFDYFEKFRDRVTGQITMKPREVDVKGKTVIIIDDIIATGGTLREATKIVKSMGAKRVFTVATHCLLLENADVKLREAGIERIICSDTIETPYSEVKTSTLVAEYIQQLLK